MNKTALDRAIKCLRPQGVFLLRSNFNIRDDIVLPTKGESDWTSQNALKPLEDFFIAEAEDEHGSKVNLVGYKILCATRQLKKIDVETAPAEIGVEDERIVSSLVAMYSAMYEKTCEIDDEALTEFGKYNASYHVNPFWRAHVQEIYSKAGMPFPIVPFAQVAVTNGDSANGRK